MAPACNMHLATPPGLKHGGGRAARVDFERRPARWKLRSPVRVDFERRPARWKWRSPALEGAPGNAVQPAKSRGMEVEARGVAGRS
jgi:hypothetical protein